MRPVMSIRPFIGEMSKRTVWLVPQLENGNTNYLGRTVTYLSHAPVRIPGFDLYVQVHELDSVMSPFVVIPIEAEGNSAVFYRATLDDVTGIDNSCFKVKEVTEGSVLYVPNELFETMEARMLYVRVPKNEWVVCQFRFHVLAAFYGLSIAPTLSLSLFSDETLFSRLCDKFYADYHTSPPLERALASVFAELLFALELFDFATPTNENERQTLREMQEISSEFTNHQNESVDDRRCFAFADLGYAIMKYHKQCGAENDSCQIEADEYNGLRNGVEIVRRTLEMFDMLPNSNTEHQSMLDGVEMFQKTKGLPPGLCDSYTFRQLWNASMSDESDLEALCRMSGLVHRNYAVPVYPRTLSKVDIHSQELELKRVQRIVNQVLGGIKDHSDAPQWIIGEVQDSAVLQMERIDEVSEMVNDMKRKITGLNDKIDAAPITSFGEASSVLDKMIEDNSSVIARFTNIQRRLRDEHRASQILMFLLGITVCILIYRLI